MSNIFRHIFLTLNSLFCKKMKELSNFEFNSHVDIKEIGWIRLLKIF